MGNAIAFIGALFVIALLCGVYFPINDRLSQEDILASDLGATFHLIFTPFWAGISIIFSFVTFYVGVKAGSWHNR